VRLVGPEGEQIGIVPIDKALRLAQDTDLDLVEVAPTARPPVCKLMDYGKFKYENAQTEDRPARLRDQEGSRGAVPQGRGQGQDHDHVPRS
jgi:translation initiation factor IF-3